jgi:hypothetical protein
MKAICRFCEASFIPKAAPPKPEAFEHLIHAQVFAVGSILNADVCERKACQRQAQHECDEYDAWRKDEY